MKILIADDNKIDRLILSRILEKYDYDVIQAEDGEQAVSLFNEHSPALVLLDVLMPGYDGYEVAEIIKKDTSKGWFPIIFLTSLSEATDIARCIKAGGDDFVSKPINRIIIKAKIDAFIRIIKLYDTVASQKEEIRFHNERLIQEQEAAIRIFNNIVHLGCLNSDNINYHLSPMSIFNGDLMIAAELPLGGMRLMLADFTGHGLPAAIGAMPASEIFYSMTNKGFSIHDMMIEMNKRLYTVLPRGIFSCVIVLDIDVIDKMLTIWNAGAPDSYLIDQKNETVQLLSSSHLPIGIQSPEKFEVNCQSYEFTENHKIVAVTDGIVEAEDNNAKMFGEQRLLDCIKQSMTKTSICDALMVEVTAYTGKNEQSDDISLLEVSFPTTVDIEEHAQKEDGSANIHGTSDAELSLNLRGNSLGSFDPIPLFLQTLLSCSELVPHRARIFTVLSELYNNALDHGVLGLDSAMKNDSNGFAQYYQKREQGLSDVGEGFVNVSVDHQPTKNGGRLIFTLTDSGDGFDVKSVINNGSKNYSGRGLPLLISLCDSVNYLDDGSRVEAVYSWDRNDLPE